MAYALKLQDAHDQLWAWEGYRPGLGGWSFDRPINAHVHVRSPYDSEEIGIFNMVVPESARLYRWVTAMPNLKKKRIRTIAGARDYKNLIRACGRRFNENFDVTIPFYIEEGLNLRVIESGFKQNVWISGKLYPKNGTTNSAEGVDFLKIRELWPLFALMERLGILLLIHAEVVCDSNGSLILDRLRELESIRIISAILESFPRLKVVVEHITTKQMVIAIKGWQKDGYQVEATIAPQYLLWNSTKLFEGGMNPVAYSIPILKDEDDRLAVLDFMLHGGGMLGTDSAPHDITKKSKHEGCPGGVFNEPVGLFVYFHMFRTHGGPGWFKKFLEFACYKAARFYNLPHANEKDKILILERDFLLPEVYEYDSGHMLSRVVPMFAGMTMPYSAESLAA